MHGDDSAAPGPTCREPASRRPRWRSARSAAGWRPGTQPRMRNAPRNARQYSQLSSVAMPRAASWPAFASASALPPPRRSASRRSIAPSGRHRPAGKGRLGTRQLATGQLAAGAARLRAPRDRRGRPFRATWQRSTCSPVIAASRPTACRYASCASRCRPSRSRAMPRSFHATALRGSRCDASRNKVSAAPGSVGEPEPPQADPRRNRVGIDP